MKDLRYDTHNIVHELDAEKKRPMLPSGEYIFLFPIKISAYADFLVSSYLLLISLQGRRKQDVTLTKTRAEIQKNHLPQITDANDTVKQARKRIFMTQRLHRDTGPSQLVIPRRSHLVQLPQFGSTDGRTSRFNFSNSRHGEKTKH
jgi:hypothetical protein